MSRILSKRSGLDRCLERLLTRECHQSARSALLDICSRHFRISVRARDPPSRLVVMDFATPCLSTLWHLRKHTPHLYFGAVCTRIYRSRTQITDKKRSRRYEPSPYCTSPAHALHSVSRIFIQLNYCRCRWPGLVLTALQCYGCSAEAIRAYGILIYITSSCGKRKCF